MRRLGVFRSQPGECIIQRDDLVRGWTNRHVLIVQVDTLEVAAVLDSFLPPGILDEDAAHGLRGRGEEVAPTLELLIVHQTQEMRKTLLDSPRDADILCTAKLITP